MTEAGQCWAHRPGKVPVPVGMELLSSRACLSSLSENKFEGQQCSLKYSAWALTIHTVSRQRNMRLKGSNTHIYTIFLGQDALYSGSKRHDAKRLGLPLHSGWGRLAPVPCSAQLSAVTSVRSPCSLRLPRPQSHSFQRSPMSHAGRPLGRRGGAPRHMSVPASSMESEAEKRHVGKEAGSSRARLFLNPHPQVVCSSAPRHWPREGKETKGSQMLGIMVWQ